jgi:transcriptional regulator with XRE-family HTH domain
MNTDRREVRVTGRGLKTGRRYDLKTLRISLNRTQSAVARTAGMAQGDVSKLESRQDVKLSTLARYAAALGGVTEVAVVIDGRRYLLDL